MEDNLPAAEYCTPALTTINQNRLHIGKAAFSTMLLIKNGVQISSVQLHTSLIERESVADIKDTLINAKQSFRRFEKCTSLRL